MHGSWQVLHFPKFVQQMFLLNELCISTLMSTAGS
jgi:hypothetical protein